DWSSDVCSSDLLRRHDEGAHALFRRRIQLEVRHVGAGPAGAVPPHQALLHRVPGLAVRAGRGTVVEDPPVGRPGPGPAEGLAHAERVGVVATRHQVALLAPGAAVDPAAGRGRTVGAQLTEAGQLLAG